MSFLYKQRMYKTQFWKSAQLHGDHYMTSVDISARIEINQIYKWHYFVSKRGNVYSYCVSWQQIFFFHQNHFRIFFLSSSQLQLISHKIFNTSRHTYCKESLRIDWFIEGSNFVEQSTDYTKDGQIDV